ncbi:unnamed protein product [Linum tenue]|uniref:Uncharacterized protein n=1 Tax=Linum tenue TaxID=586396 RepID=A0AAV0JL56_9ROSI|nr:unnamed protein product [Linum tenue]
MVAFFSLELITGAASNSVMVFFFCNLIIVTILVASSIPPPSTTCEIHHVSTVGTPYLYPYVTIHQQEETLVIGGENDALHLNDENRASWSLSCSEPKLAALATTPHQDEEEEEEKEDEEEEKEADCCGGENGKEDYNDNDEYDEEEEEDELRRRVEEFIEKTNKAWRAELLRTSKSPRLMIAG